MTERQRFWPVRIAAAAEADFQDILRWTAEHFGEAQARGYAQTLSMGPTKSARPLSASGGLGYRHLEYLNPPTGER